MSLDLDAVRARFGDGRCHQVVLHDVVTAALAASLRDFVDDAGFEAFSSPDRGRYERNATLAVPELFDELRGLVAAIVDRPVQVGAAAWSRLRHRDYALLKDDAKLRVDGPHVEATLDFSAHATGQAEIVYTDGAQTWPIAQVPGSLAVVERAPWLFRYERYLDHRLADGRVYRLRLALV